VSEQEIRIGQIWRRKRNGRHIRIIGQQRGGWGGALVDDYVWEGADYKGRGYSYGTYIRRDCELVTEAPDA
jgi:hypothetical protein